MRLTDYKKIKYIHRLLLKRYGKGVLLFLNIFFALIILLLILTLFSVIKTTNPELSKQLIVFLIMMLIMGDLTNIFSIINVETVLSTAIIKNYPISNMTHLKLIYFCYVKHDRSIMYIFLTLYLSYLLLGFPLLLAILILGLTVLYLTTTLLLALLFYFLDFISFKYGVKKIALLFLPILLLPAFLDSTRVIFDNFLINFIYHFLLKLVA